MLTAIAGVEFVLVSVPGVAPASRGAGKNRNGMVRIQPESAYGVVQWVGQASVISMVVTPAMTTRRAPTSSHM